MPTALAMLEAARREPPPALAAGTHPGQEYPRECYRRALDYLFRYLPRLGGHGRLPDGAVLVHGLPAWLLDYEREHGDPRGDHGGFGHAWVELPGGLLFDGTRQRFYDREAYLRAIGQVAVARYTWSEASVLWSRLGHAGPWWPGDGGVAAILTEVWEVLGRQGRPRRRRGAPRGGTL